VRDGDEVLGCAVSTRRPLRPSLDSTGVRLMRRVQAMPEYWDLTGEDHLPRARYEECLRFPQAVVVVRLVAFARPNVRGNRPAEAGGVRLARDSGEAAARQPCAACRSGSG
jgi:hypothetical protein